MKYIYFQRIRLLKNKIAAELRLNTKKVKVKTAVNNFSSDIHSGIYYKQNNKSTHILSEIFPSISYNISYRSMLKNTDIITNIKSNDILSYYFTFSL